MFEPRGHHDMYGAWLVAPSLPGADLAVLFMHNEGYSTMCGHATIALARWGSALPRIPDGDVVVVIDAAARGAAAATPFAVATDAVLRRWPAATLLLVGIAAALATAVAAGRS